MHNRRPLRFESIETMKRAILLLFFLAGLIFLAGAPRAAPSIQSSLNSLPLGSGENVKEYSF